jgi:hypothetical protein
MWYTYSHLNFLENRSLYAQENCSRGGVRFLRRFRFCRTGACGRVVQAWRVERG